MELYRLLQQQGFGGRKECRQLIEYGLVEVNGEVVDNYRAQFEPTDISSLVVDDEPWPLVIGPLYLLLHKPANYETSHKPQCHPSIYRLLPDQFSNLDLSAVGRLDVDTTGLILLSNNGQFIHALSSPKKLVAKVYRVTLKHEATPELISQLQSGVYLNDEAREFAADSVEQLDAHTIRLTITEGKYHQVKRMVAAASNRVEALHRESLGSIALGDLPAGKWRHLSAEELAAFGF
ncbi:pseudouridine synthase [Chromobacterium sphagni]|uniref:Pseudouridine synthase n=1 Tax=Chromobacterium sphagni TaxID=1903179 RepID=A0A1S1WYI9_9NEIS|nr:16S rRNA pseudouridine(516) synthase [Chromobacterium sphagni]OHX12324.1 16S rRNA pseudouridine(516) synthase [Chromobacterium sphagni]OHX21592.1 16S rRNA pseudouridine(516) synthase [Chromobacterium sphagni]